MYDNSPFNRIYTHSWRQLNGLLAQQLDLAITAHLGFDVGDFEILENKFGFLYWGGIHGNNLGEGFYSLAVEKRNIGACKSFEHWKKRRPFFLNHERIYVGRDFQLEEGLLTCTSFFRDQSGFVACSYHDKDRTKVKSVHKISRETLRK